MAKTPKHGTGLYFCPNGGPVYLRVAEGRLTCCPCRLCKDMAQDLRAAEHGPVPHWKKGFKTPVFLTQIAIDLSKTTERPSFWRVPQGPWENGDQASLSPTQISRYARSRWPQLCGYPRQNRSSPRKIGLCGRFFLTDVLCLSL